MIDGVLRVIVVDDRVINQRGTRSVLEDIPHVEVVETSDFEGAMTRERWDDVDWVLIDVAYEYDDHEQTPSVPLIERIRSMTPDSRSPMLVAVTSNPIAYRAPVIMRRLLEADPDVGLVWRHDLEEHIKGALGANELAQALDSIGPPGAPREIAELGITANTKVNRLVTRTRELLGRRRSEFGTWQERERIAYETGLRAATERGRSPRNTETPSLKQYKRIKRAAGLPPGGDSPQA